MKQFRHELLAVVQFLLGGNLKFGPSLTILDLEIPLKPSE